MKRLITAAGISLLVFGCAGDVAGPVQRFGTDSYPQSLSQWRVVLARDDVLELGEGVLPYDLNTPLFTDYAHKLRTIWMPPGATGSYNEAGVFELPVGTILSKTFYYPKAREPAGALLRNEISAADFAGDGLDLNRMQLLETRLLVRQESGWDALPYIWDAQQKDAHLEIAGDLQRHQLVARDSDVSELIYVVPTRNECAACHASDHTSGKLQPIGIAARHLNKEYEHYADGAAPQLERWVAQGYLDRAPHSAPANALWQAGAFDDLEHRARSYLDVNCGHCHNPQGAADTSGLFLNSTETSARRLGVCKPPIAAGRGTGGRFASIVPGAPDASILIHRVDSTDPGVMMPELGRTSTHEAGVELLRRWITALPGSCG